MSSSNVAIASSPSVLSWSSSLCWSVECSQPVMYDIAKSSMPEELTQAKVWLSSLLAEVMQRDPSNPAFKGNPSCAPEEVARVVLERERSSLVEGFPTKEEQWQVRWAVLVLFERQSLNMQASDSGTKQKSASTPTHEEIYKALDVRPDDIKWLVDRNVPTEKIMDLFRAFVSAKLHFENSPGAPEFVQRLYENPRAQI